MDERSRLRQFWLRVLLALGLLWGTVPLITVPFVFRGANDSTFDVLVAVFNCLTILPACILAFWHRRMACIWLTFNGAMLATAVALSVRRIHQYDLRAIVGIFVPVLIAICLDFTEAKHWPGALDQ
jgi:hypothetical protein